MIMSLSLHHQSAIGLLASPRYTNGQRTLRPTSRVVRKRPLPYHVNHLYYCHCQSRLRLHQHQQQHRLGYGLRLGDRFGLLHGVYRLSFHHVQSRWSVCVQIDFRSLVGSSLLLFCSGFVNRFHVLRAAVSMVAVRPASLDDAGQSFVLGAAGGTLSRYTAGHIHRCIVNVVARFTEGSFTNIQDKDARTING